MNIAFLRVRTKSGIRHVQFFTSWDEGIYEYAEALKLQCQNAELCLSVTHYETMPCNTIVYCKRDGDCIRHSHNYGVRGVSVVLFWIHLDTNVHENKVKKFQSWDEARIQFSELTSTPRTGFFLARLYVVDNDTNRFHHTISNEKVTKYKLVGPKNIAVYYNVPIQNKLREISSPMFVSVTNISTGKVEKKSFDSWDASLDYFKKEIVDHPCQHKVVWWVNKLTVGALYSNACHKNVFEKSYLAFPFDAHTDIHRGSIKITTSKTSVVNFACLDELKTCLNALKSSGIRATILGSISGFYKKTITSDITGKVNDETHSTGCIPLCFIKME